LEATLNLSRSAINVTGLKPERDQKKKGKGERRLGKKKRMLVTLGGKKKSVKGVKLPSTTISNEKEGSTRRNRRGRESLGTLGRKAGKQIPWRGNAGVLLIRGTLKLLKKGGGMGQPRTGEVWFKKNLGPGGCATCSRQARRY